MTLEEIFNDTKLTENGDISFSRVSKDNELLNILFATEFYQKHLDQVPLLESTEINQLFSMFIRDPRFGLGRRDLGRKLMSMTYCSIFDIVKAGRIDDLLFMEYKSKDNLATMLNWCKEQIIAGNELVKKWMPRYSSKNLTLARQIAKHWGMNKQQYGHFIKCNTTENKLSRRNYDEIEFEHVPSLAMIKYASAFAKKPELATRYSKYLEDVKSGKKELKVSTTTVYDIFKNRQKIDADLFFSKIEMIKGSWMPIVDTSGSMWDSNDSIGKALAIGHYLAKCSSYCPNKVLSFSSRPQLITLGDEPKRENYFGRVLEEDNKSQYGREIASMYTGDCSNTNFKAVMDRLAMLDGDMPQYLIVLSDMEFDEGSSMSKDQTMNFFKSKGYTTKIVWWNFNARSITAPEMDNYGNIFLSGYNPMLLKYLQARFDAKAFLYKLLEEYKKNIQG